MKIETPATKLSAKRLSRLEYMLSIMDTADAVDLVCSKTLSAEEREILTQQINGNRPVNLAT